MTDSFTEDELERYYRREPVATERAVQALLRDTRNPHMVVYGGKAVNAHLPDWLDKETKDWDVVTVGNAERLAGKLEGMLDRKYGGDYFAVEPAIHLGTFRVRSKVTGVVVADMSLQDREIDFRRIAGINYATLDWIEDDVEKIIADPETKFRRSKDIDTLRRIRVHKRRSKGARRRGATSRYVDGSSVDTSMRGLL